MASIFFQISRTDFLEASKIYGIGGKEFGLRVVSFQNGIPIFVYLPEVSLSELSILASIMRVRIVPNLRRIEDLQKYFVNVIYYY